MHWNRELPDEVPITWWKEALEGIPHPVACVGVDNVFWWVNTEYEKLVGYTYAELRTKTWMDITWHDDIGGDAAAVSDLVQGIRNSYTIAKRYRHRLGHQVNIILSVARYPTNTSKQLECFIVSAQQRSTVLVSQEELRECNERWMRELLAIKEQFVSESKQRQADDRQHRHDDNRGEVSVNVSGDSSRNSDRFVNVLGAAIVAMAIVLAWIAYYVFSRPGQVQPPAPMPVSQAIDEQRMNNATCLAKW